MSKQYYFKPSCQLNFLLILFYLYNYLKKKIFKKKIKKTNEKKIIYINLTKYFTYFQKHGKISKYNWKNVCDYNIKKRLKDKNINKN